MTISFPLPCLFGVILCNLVQTSCVEVQHALSRGLVRLGTGQGNGFWAPKERKKQTNEETQNETNETKKERIVDMKPSVLFVGVCFHGCVGFP